MNIQPDLYPEQCKYSTDLKYCYLWYPLSEYPLSISVCKDAFALEDWFTGYRLQEILQNFDSLKWNIYVVSMGTKAVIRTHWHPVTYTGSLVMHWITVIPDTENYQHCPVLGRMT